MQIGQNGDTQDDDTRRVDMQAISVNWEMIHQQKAAIGEMGAYLYMVLRSCCTRRNPRVAVASVSELAQMTGWGEMSVRRYLAKLEKAGLIERMQNFDRYNRPVASSYQLLA